MDEKKPGDGWTPGRVLGLIAGLLGMAWFGGAGLCGAVLAALFPGSRIIFGTVVVLGAFLLCLWLFVAMIRRGARKRRNQA